MTHRDGRLIYLDGIDGAGKSTVADALRQRCDPATLLSVSKSSFSTDDPDLAAYLHSVNKIVYQRPAHVGARCGDRYWLLALAAWHELLDELVLRPALASGFTVLVDNSPLKTIARYLVSGAVPAALVRDVFEGLSTPDLVLIFDVDPAEALRRKGSYTRVEAGGSRDRAEYLEYQAAVRQALTSWDGMDSRKVVIDTTGRAVDEVVELAWAQVSSLAPGVRACG